MIARPFVAEALNSFSYNTRVVSDVSKARGVTGAKLVRVVVRAIASRVPFFITVALIAAALGDPLVETISNTGILGRGYSDNNHLSVLPTLIAGATLALLIACQRVIERLRGAEHHDWLIDEAKRISADSWLRIVPYVIILQFAALFMMESIEQLAFNGRLAGGMVWLGGPLWFSVLAHALITLFATYVVTRTMRAFVRNVQTIVAILCEFIQLVSMRAGSAGFAKRDRDARGSHRQTLRSRQLGERAPPLLPTLTQT